MLSGANQKNVSNMKSGIVARKNHKNRLIKSSKTHVATLDWIFSFTCIFKHKIVLI